MLSALSLQAMAQGLVVSGSTYVRPDLPNDNFSYDAPLILKNNLMNTVNVRLGYLKFDLSAVTTDFPSNFGLNMVVVGNNQGATPSPPQSFAGATSADPGTFIIQVWGLNANTAWDETTVTWNNAPGSPAVINSASQTRYGFNETQSTLLATCSVAANRPNSTFHCASSGLLNFMNARKGTASVTLMFRRTDTNAQANLSMASARLVPAGGSAGDYSPTFAAPNAVGRTFATGPMGASVGNPPTVTTAVPTSVVNGSQLEATLGGNVTDTGGDSPSQFVQYRLASGGPWISVDMGLSTGTASSSGGVYSRALSALSQNTSYEVQAYATNSRGTAYGAVLTLTTAAAPVGMPVVTTATPTSASSNNQVEAMLAGSVTINGNENPTRFIQYRLTSGGAWTVVDLMSADASSAGYSTLVNTLAPSTSYDVQAFATNSAGTGFGAILAFTTAAAVVAPGAGTPVPIPSLSVWGSAMLTLLMALAGLKRLRRRTAGA